jgi:cytochrome d ubiquinol oxidase subunit I
MFADLDPVLLARIQFAFTVAFHIIFPAFTIGLASLAGRGRVALAEDR